MGIQPTYEGLTIDPAFPQKAFKFSTSTLTLNLNETEICGFYKPIREDDLLIRIKKPQHWSTNILVTINEQDFSKNYTIEEDWFLIKYKIPKTGMKFSFKKLND